MIALLCIGVIIILIFLGYFLDELRKYSSQLFINLGLDYEAEVWLPLAS
jgi:hypothetical protein